MTHTLPMSRSALGLVLLVAATFASGCAGVRSSGVATGPGGGPPRSGPVAVFMAQPLPAGAREVGLVEARGYGDHDGVDEIFPELVVRAQELGANAIVIDWIGPRFDFTPNYGGYAQMYPCGRTTCMSGTMSQPTEIMTVVMRGRAFVIPEAP